MIRHDPELGPSRVCRVCRELWPLGWPFYRKDGATCEACLSDRNAGRPTRLRVRTDQERRRDRERKAAARRDPVRGDRLRARERDTQARWYERNREAEQERRRDYYARQLDRPVRVGFGRPRIAA